MTDETTFDTISAALAVPKIDRPIDEKKRWKLICTDILVEEILGAKEVAVTAKKGAKAAEAK